MFQAIVSKPVFFTMLALLFVPELLVTRWTGGVSTSFPLPIRLCRRRLYWWCRGFYIVGAAT